MSRLAYYTDFVAMPALILSLLAFGDWTGLGIVLGLGAWTIAEYAIHRCLFHRVPWFKPAHDEHHAHPSGRTGVSSLHSAAIFLGLACILPAGALIGFTVGYLAYITVHHVVHHWRVWPGHPLYGVKMRHRMHHRGIEANFGITTSLWDRVFRTYRPAPDRSTS